MKAAEKHGVDNPCDAGKKRKEVIRRGKRGESLILKKPRGKKPKDDDKIAWRNQPSSSSRRSTSGG